MNKCDDDDEFAGVVEYYTLAKQQAKATNLPDLSKASDLLMVNKIGGVKKSLKGEAL
jgi:hypothetical protein